MTNPHLQPIDEVLESLLSEIPRADPGARWEICGSPTSGRSTLLRRLRLGLEEASLRPVLVVAPAPARDAASSALLQLAGGLHDRGVVNGALDVVKDPRMELAERLGRLRQELSIGDTDDVVVLTDEPDRWSSPSGGTPQPFGRQARLIREAFQGLGFRQVSTHGPRSLSRSSAATKAGPRVHHLEGATPEEWREDPATWGPLGSLSSELGEALGGDSTRYSPLEWRLLVAVAAVDSLDAAAGLVRGRAATVPRRAIAETLSRGIATNESWEGLRTLWAKLALLRRPFSMALVEQLHGAPMVGKEREILQRCLLFEEDEHWHLHELLRADAQDTWLEARERERVHALLSEHYHEEFVSITDHGGDVSSWQEALASEVEAFHHAAESHDVSAMDRLSVYFVEQLDSLGQVLSKDARDYPAAVRVYDRALAWKADDDYAHHYLAYNLDIQGIEPGRVARHYLEAISLDEANTWWWSRWISFLITRGRLEEAELAWNRAIDLVTAAGASAHVYWHLHRWVSGLLAHRAQVDLARRVLRDIQRDLVGSEGWLRGIERYLRALEAAHDQEAVFPLSVPPEKWWQGPHLCGSRSAGGEPLARWLAGRIDLIDEQGVFLTVGEAPGIGEGAPRFGEMQIPRSSFDQWTGNERSSELIEGRFIEIGFYGAIESETVRIRVHPDEDVAEGLLPAQEMDPTRYLRAAGWTSDTSAGV